MPTLNVVVDKDLEYVGFWLRAWAAVADTVMYLILAWFLLMVFARKSARFALETTGSTADILINYLLPLVIVVALWVRYGTTPGKQLIGAKIVDATTGQPLRLGQALVRYFGYILSCLPLFAGLVWVAFDRKKQGWHDKLANTVVVRAKRTEIVHFQSTLR